MAQVHPHCFAALAQNWEQSINEWLVVHEDAIRGFGPPICIYEYDEQLFSLDYQSRLVLQCRWHQCTKGIFGSGP
jgi:hypothetical protein